MSRKFHIHKKNYYGPQTLYKSEWLDLEDNQIYCLVGCNGIGKSTILRQMVHDNEGSLDKTAWDLLENYVGWSLRGISLFGEPKKQEDFDEFYFSANRETRIGKNFDDVDLQNIWCNFQSTGESNTSNFTPLFKALADSIKQIPGKTYFIMLDDFDVGTSIDVLQDFVKVVKAIEKLCIKNNIKYYIVITANAYELAKNFRCIDCITMGEVSFNDYEEYSKYVKETRKYKDSRDLKGKRDKDGK